MKARAPTKVPSRKLSAPQLRAYADKLAKKYLGLPSHLEAFKALDRGEHTGSIVGAELSMVRWLMGE